jgi:hypothetical protein
MPDEVDFAELRGVMQVLGYTERTLPVGEWCEWTRADDNPAKINQLM